MVPANLKESCTPFQIYMEPKNHPNWKEQIIFQKLHDFGFNILIFQGVLGGPWWLVSS